MRKTVSRLLVVLVTGFLLSCGSTLAQAPSDTPFIARGVPAITNDWILPTSAIPKTAPRGLLLAACPGEYEPVSFVVKSFRDLEGLTVTCSDLTSTGGVIDAAAIDIKLVKCWYQSGSGWKPAGAQQIEGKLLVSELLVNDDDLVRVDFEKKQNLLRVTVPHTGRERYMDVTKHHSSLKMKMIIRDADTLQPVNIPARQVRQFWVTVHVPDDASAGTYEGKLTIRCEGSSDVVLPLRLEVHPFKLAPSAVVQSIFYRGQLTGHDVPFIDDNAKTEEQYEAEIRNMVAHGVDAPMCYQPPGGGKAAMDLMRRALEIRRDAGVSTDRFFGCFWGYGPEDDPDQTRRVLGEVIELTKSFGYREYFNYGPDEAGVEQTKKQLEPWRFLREEIGAKVYLAASPNVWTGTNPARRKLWNQVKKVVNIFLAGGTPNPKWASRLHQAGLLIFNYANPQCGIEEPLTYRRNCGLLLWKTNYDGVMNYAYHATFGGHMWNDFDRSSGDSRGYRDHVMAYATSNGVVDTLQWEGRREAVDDLRYLSTLLEKIEEASKDPARAAEARNIKRYVMSNAGINQHGNLDKTRAKMVQLIMRLLPAEEQ